jgi:excisionase family DNA binding protein
MSASRRRGHPGTSWLGLGSASRLLGVSPATLRRWSDSGTIKTFTTPGGHRRFPRAALEAMLPRQRGRRPTLARLGETAERVTRLLGDRARRSTVRPRWLDSLDEARRSAFRERGRLLAAALLAYLDARTPRARRDRLDACASAAADYGRFAASDGMTLADAVEGFLRFRGPFMAEMAALSRRSGLDTAEATELLGSAESAMDRLLVATMHGHAEAAGGDRVRRAGERPSREGSGIV